MEKVKINIEPPVVNDEESNDATLFKYTVITAKPSVPSIMSAGKTSVDRISPGVCAWTCVEIPNNPTKSKLIFIWMFLNMMNVQGNWLH